MTNPQKSKYAISLDMGTNSIGWACVWEDGDNDGALVRKRGKNLWGARLFEEAKSAKDYRGFRRARRTIGKRLWRLNLLKQELKDKVLQEDPNFYKNLYLSQKKPDDRKYLLFNDQDYTDVNYFTEFPTIYHLRFALTNSDKVKQFQQQNRYYRFLFLAIHDILKNRGHFLINGSLDFSNQNSETKLNDQIALLVNDLVSFKLLNETDIELDVINDYFENNRELDKKDSKTKTLINILDGKKASLKKIFNYEGSFSFEGFKKSELDQLVTGDDDIDFALRRMYEVYAYIISQKLLKDNSTISEAKVKTYCEHKRQLHILKKLLKNDSDKFNEFFGADGYYTKYVKTYLEGNKIKRYYGNSDKNDKKTPYEKLLLAINELDNNEIKGFTFPLPNGEENRDLPYQLHLQELDKILQLSPLSATTKDHIKKLLTFKAEYYFGPLSDAIKGENYWLEKVNNCSEKITPYNFDDVIDKEKTNENFIKRMKRKCSYLENEDTMQQETILYQEYIFYNVINKIEINNCPINSEQKQIVYDYFKDGNKTIGKKQLHKLLLLNEEDRITKGFSDSDDNYKIPISLSAVIKFNKIFPNADTASKQAKFFDAVVDEISIIDDKNQDLKKKIIKQLSSKYEICLDDSKVEELIKFKSNKYGNLSQKFLELDVENPDNGTEMQIIEILRETNYNLQGIIFHNKNQDYIERENKKEELDLNNTNSLNNYLKEQYIPTIVRRPIIQAVKLIDEITRIIGYDPSHITIEFTRGEDKKQKGKVTVDRKQQLSTILATLPNDLFRGFEETDIKKLQESLKNENISLKSKSLYLYFSQLGRDMYTGEKIDINDIIVKNKVYDIDHIYPKSKILDDSIHNNLVLTRSTINSKKTNNYPLDPQTQNNQRNFWKYLRDKKLITTEKYNRLVRQIPISDEEYEQFVSRQKNVLDWVNLRLAKLLKKKFFKEESNDFIIYSKSGNVSTLRNLENVKLCKFRNLNKFHHAFDAYLNEISSRIIRKHLRVESDNGLTHNVEKILETITGKLRIKNASFSEYAKKIFSLPDQLITKKTSVKSQGAFWDQLIVRPKNKGKNENDESFIPIKKKLNNASFGSYSSAKTAFFSAIEYQIKKKKIKEVIAIPTYKCSRFYKNDEFKLDLFEKYIKSEFGSNVIIKEPIIPISTLVEIDGLKMRIAGITGKSLSFHNTFNLTLSPKNYNYFRILEKEYEKIKEDTKIKEKTSDSNFLSKPEITKVDNELLMTEIYNKIIIAYEKNFISKKIYDRFEGDYMTEFKELNLGTQVEWLYVIIHNVLKSNVSNQGKFRSKTFFDCTIGCKSLDEFTIIKESITGFYTKRKVIFSKNV